MSFLGLKLGRKIENAQNDQNKFFQNASHELKTPLMSIQGYAEAIQTDVMEHHKAADVIMEESERMTGLVNDILAISRIDSGQLRLSRMELDVREVLYDCINSQKFSLQKNNITASLDFCDTKAAVNGDEEQLRKAFMNIIANDIRYCCHELRIECDKKSAYIFIRFIDDGPGIDTELLDRIFERFSTGQKGQTGIGLALTKEIITLHDGKITASNKENEGTVFEIRLPEFC